MQLVWAEGTRGLALLLDLTLDRLLMPAAILVALGAAAVLGLQLGDLMPPALVTPHQL